MLSKPFFIVLFVYDNTIIQVETQQVKPSTEGEVSGSQRKAEEGSFNLAQFQIGLFKQRMARNGKFLLEIPLVDLVKVFLVVKKSGLTLKTVVKTQ